MLTLKERTGDPSNSRKRIAEGCTVKIHFYSLDVNGEEWQIVKMYDEGIDIIPVFS